MVGRSNGSVILKNDCTFVAPSMDVTSDNKLLLWFMDKIELPLANLCGHGDVTIATREVVTECCKKAGLKVEKLEIRKGMRMHCVVRK